MANRFLRSPNSLLTGKNTGKFAKLGPASQLLHCLVVSVFRPLWPNFPKQSNREFWARKQGSYYPEQGSHSAPSGTLPAQIIRWLRGRGAGKKRLRVFLPTFANSSVWQRKPTATSALSHKRSGSRSPAATSVTMRRAMACRTLSGPAIREEAPREHDHRPCPISRP